MAGGLRDGGGPTALGAPRIPEEIEDRDQDAEGRHRSGNVFRDLGDPDTDLKQAKAILAARIIAVLDKRGLSVRKAAELTRFAAADFSRICNADLGRFTLDRLMKMLAALDGSLRVTLHVAKRRGREAVMATTTGG